MIHLISGKTARSAHSHVWVNFLNASWLVLDYLAYQISRISSCLSNTYLSDANRKLTVN